MIGLRSALATLFLSTAFVSRPLVAQMGFASGIHTVSVTIPPRVKVQVSPFSAAMSPSSAIATNKQMGGVAVSVTATQPWILSIGTSAETSRSVKWSHGQNRGYVAISPQEATVASGSRGAMSADATLFVRNDSTGRTNDADAAVVLTLAAR
ncbi:MAG TPA: hypothetical protein VM166_01645 [Gemmatimonadaceae bacterium]|nr:hypothetical protein [Gemmatimonadaceae bacterium]